MRNDIFHAKPHTISNNLFPKELFDEFGEISGSSDKITPELAMSIGRVSAGVATRIAVGYSDCTLCRLLAGAFVSGAAAAGAQITEFGTSFFAAASYLARAYLFNLMVFFENDGQRLGIRITDKFGLPIERSLQKKIEDAVSSSEINCAGISDIIMPKSILGTLDVFVSSMARRESLSDFSVAVSGTSLAADTLRRVLTACGASLSPKKRGICELSVSDDGMKLFLRNESDRLYDDAHAKAASAYVFFSSGGESLAVSHDSPGVLEQIALEHGGRLFRIGRDPAAREIYLSQEILCNAIGDAVILLSHINENRISADALFSSLPDFTLVSRELGLKSNRRKLLGNLQEMCRDMYSENTGSLRICTDGGWVNICPSHSAASLRITGEGMNEEIASELCNLFVEKATTIDNLPDK